MTTHEKYVVKLKGGYYWNYGRYGGVGAFSQATPMDKEDAEKIAAQMRGLGLDPAPELVRVRPVFGGKLEEIDE